MRSIAALTVSEARLFLRDGMAVLFGLLFPSLLLLIFGRAIPGFREAPPELGGLRVLDIYLPILIAMGVATIAITTLPASVAAYRERGVLRRMATTPIGPGALLTAQLIVNLLAMVVSVAISLTVGVVFMDIPLPASFPLFLLVLLLATVAMFAIGLLLAAVVPTAKAASGLGMLIYFPMLFFAGVWTPGPAMPEAVRRIGEWTPLGAASQALTDTWSGAGTTAQSLLVMSGYAVVVSLLAARLFRWS